MSGSAQLSGPVELARVPIPSAGENRVGATALQIVHSSRRGSRDVEHIGPAHDKTELEVLQATARPRLVADKEELDLGLEGTEPARRGAPPLPSRAAWPVPTLPRRHADRDPQVADERTFGGQSYCAQRSAPTDLLQGPADTRVLNSIALGGLSPGRLISEPAIQVGTEP